MYLVGYSSRLFDTPPSFFTRKQNYAIFFGYISMFSMLKKEKVKLFYLTQTPFMNCFLALFLNLKCAKIPFFFREGIESL